MRKWDTCDDVVWRRRWKRREVWVKWWASRLAYARQNELYRVLFRLRSDFLRFSAGSWEEVD